MNEAIRWLGEHAFGPVFAFAGVVAGAYATYRATREARTIDQEKVSVDQAWRFRERNDTLEKMNATLHKRVWLLETEQYEDRGFIRRIMKWVKRGRRTGFPSPPRWYIEQEEEEE